jgi:hypothetical protein
MTLFKYDNPPEHQTTWLAPRVKGRGDYVGEYGFALELYSDGSVLVEWDEEGRDRVDPTTDVTFIRPRPTCGCES